MIVLLALIASLVTRWVVIPVRHAAQAAQRLTAGRLEERMRVRGADDLAANSRPSEGPQPRSAFTAASAFG